MVAPPPQGPWPYPVPPPDEYLEDAAQPLFVSPPPHRRHHAYAGNPFVALLVLLFVVLLITAVALALSIWFGPPAPTPG